MNTSQTAPQGAKGVLAKFIEYALQPLIIAVVLVYWVFNRENPLVHPIVVLSVQLLLGTLEYLFPARPDWLQPLKEKLTLIAILVVVYAFTMFVGVTYDNLFRASLGELRAALGMNIWPSEWPMLFQVLLAFFMAEFIWYWFHRAEHRWQIVWRLSGHGAHHSFKHLGAVNSGTNHPIEMFVILVPSMLVELLFGAGLASVGAGVLTITQATIAHCNLNMNTRYIGLLFTTNRYHIHHHSVVLEESNTNYGCSAIIWDRVFGTFADAPTRETGTGPTEPSLWGKFMMPIKEPADTQIAP